MKIVSDISLVFYLLMGCVGGGDRCVIPIFLRENVGNLAENSIFVILKII